MPRLITISDANSYIGLSDSVAADLNFRERSNGVVGWASYFVVDELIARTADPDAREAGKGRAALGRLARHATMYDGSVQRVNFLADPRDQIGEFLFGASHRKDQQAVDTYGTVVQTIANMPDSASWPQWVTEFTQNMRDHINEFEAKFAEGIWNTLVLKIVPDAVSWSDVRKNKTQADALAAGIASNTGYELCARLYVEDLADVSTVQLTEEQITAATVALMKAFPLSMRVFNALLHRVATTGADASKKEVRNTVWDMQLALSLPASSEISRTPVWLITSDELIHEAAGAANAAHLVHRLKDYITLSLDPDAWRAEIAKFEALRP
jgi:hypothetical protein